LAIAFCSKLGVNALKNFKTRVNKTPLSGAERLSNARRTRVEARPNGRRAALLPGSLAEPSGCHAFLVG